MLIHIFRNNAETAALLILYVRYVYCVMYSGDYRRFFSVCVHCLDV